MPTMTHKSIRLFSVSFHVIVMLSAWGFALVMTSGVFLWLGHLLDGLLGSSPIFMIGFFFLAVIGCFLEIYKEALEFMIPATRHGVSTTPRNINH